MLVTRLKYARVAETILPLLHTASHRHQKAQANPKVRRQRCRAAFTRTRENRIAKRWRVSYEHIRRKNRFRASRKEPTSKSQHSYIHVRNYINSGLQKQRQAICRIIRTILNIRSNSPALAIAEINRQLIKKHPKWSLSPRHFPGRRQGRPAGPGLPAGDSTGDDD